MDRASLIAALHSGRIQTSADESLTEADLAPFIDALRGLSVRPREGVGLCWNNGAGCVLAYLALMRADLVAVPLPPSLPQTQRHALWRALNCRYAWDEQGIRPLDADTSPSFWREDIHWVMHSSGSTGIPKAIPVTLEALVKNARDSMRILAVPDDSLHLGTMSQCYTNGFYNSFMLPLLTGGRVLIGPVGTALQINSIVALARSAKPDIFWVNPTVLQLLLRRAGTGDLASIRRFVSCTAALTRELAVSAEAHFKQPVLQSYGLSETMIVSIESPARRAQTEFSAGLILGGSAAAHIRQDGVLVIHNGAVMPGYATRSGAGFVYEMPEGVPGREFVSGDLASIGPAGRLLIEGRRSQMINVEGVKISPVEMEEVLNTHPQISRSAVIRITDDRGNERPAALVEASGPLDIMAAGDLCARRLGAKARPAEIRIVAKVPLTGSGKVDRAEAEKLFKLGGTHAIR